MRGRASRSAAPRSAEAVRGRPTHTRCDPSRPQTGQRDASRPRARSRCSTSAWPRRSLPPARCRKTASSAGDVTDRDLAWVPIAGMILGTAAYMSPEPGARPAPSTERCRSSGRLGAVLFEMLTGNRTVSTVRYHFGHTRFGAEAPSPIWDRPLHRRHSSGRSRRLLRRCLEPRTPRHRLHHVRRMHGSWIEHAFDELPEEEDAATARLPLRDPGTASRLRAGSIDGPRGARCRATRLLWSGDLTARRAASAGRMVSSHYGLHPGVLLAVGRNPRWRCLPNGDRAGFHRRTNSRR